MFPNRAKYVNTPSNRRPHEFWTKENHMSSGRKKKSGRKGVWRLAQTHEPHGSQRPDFSSFLPPARQISSSLFLTLGRRKKEKSLRFIPRYSRNKQNLQVSQETRTETSRRRRTPSPEPYNNKPLRPRLLCPSITSCVCRSRHLRRICWFEARREVSLLIRGDLTPSVRFDLLMRPAGLVVSGHLGAIVVIALWACGRQ